MRDGHMAKCKPCIQMRKKERKKEGNRRRTERVNGEREKGKKVFCFSLRSTEIGPWVFVGAKGKVGPRIERYA